MPIALHTIKASEADQFQSSTNILTIEHRKVLFEYLAQRSVQVRGLCFFWTICSYLVAIVP